jgi:hypothetical protein
MVKELQTSAPILDTTLIERRLALRQTRAARTANQTGATVYDERLKHYFEITAGRHESLAQPRDGRLENYINLQSIKNAIISINLDLTTQTRLNLSFNSFVRTLFYVFLHEILNIFTLL